MSKPLGLSAQKVQNSLISSGFACQIIEMPATTRTAKEAADAIGCTVDQIAKSLLFKTRETHRPILVIASGVNRVNETALGTIVGEFIEKADAAFVKDRTGFVIGGVPPCGHPEPIFTILDQELRRHQEIWAAGGSPNAVFRLVPEELERMSGGQWARIS